MNRFAITSTCLRAIIFTILFSDLNKCAVRKKPEGGYPPRPLLSRPHAVVRDPFEERWDRHALHEGS